MFTLLGNYSMNVACASCIRGSRGAREAKFCAFVAGADLSVQSWLPQFPQSMMYHCIPGATRSRSRLVDLIRHLPNARLSAASAFASDVFLTFRLGVLEIAWAQSLPVRCDSASPPAVSQPLQSLLVG